ncbi:carboxylating nicotinate-nucleotide diphosphorylase [Altericista sp. CCNU0014]|uniref:carboxylating nicotinate-nucleotide diphosphorylase n=1 Tax=Altericista sp. CCNU0014 TaxID=3082949 RepID=UPI00384E5438
MKVLPPLPPAIALDPLLQQWLLEDLGRGDRTTDAILVGSAAIGLAELRLKQTGVVAGLPLLERVFQRLDPHVAVKCFVREGEAVDAGATVATIEGSLAALLTGERVALNLVMRLSGIATLTRRYAEAIEDLPAQLVDTRKTTPGLRSLEKYATALGGARNHRFGLDDAVMIKDNHIAAAGGIAIAIQRVRQMSPFPLAIEVETETFAQVMEAVTHGADIIMLDNMPVEQMKEAVEWIRAKNPLIKIEASGNVTLHNLRQIAQTGVDFVSTSAPITQATWLDFSLRMV